MDNKPIVHPSLVKNFSALSYPEETSEKELDSQLQKIVDSILETVSAYGSISANSTNSTSSTSSGSGDADAENNRDDVFLGKLAGTVNKLHAQYANHHVSKKNNIAHNTRAREAILNKWKDQYKKLPRDTPEKADMLKDFKHTLSNTPVASVQLPAAAAAAQKAHRNSRPVAQLEMLQLLLKDPRGVLPVHTLRVLRAEMARARGVRGLQDDELDTQTQSAGDRHGGDGDAEPEEEEAELQIHGGSIPLTCPITGAEYTEPLISRKCGHVFDKHGLHEYFGVQGQSAAAAAAAAAAASRQAKECPQEACFNKLRMADFMPDEIMQLRLVLNRMTEAQKKRQNRKNQTDVIL